MQATPYTLTSTHDVLTPLRIARSVIAGTDVEEAAFARWFDDLRSRFQMKVQRVDLDALVGWSTAPDTGDIAHDSGKFFRIEGLEVHFPHRPVKAWSQPIINQPEVGILGILVREIEGVLHCLIQAKAEPGNYHGLQLCPTVQATRSNYTKVHGGSSVPYLEYFRDTTRHRVLTDVRQSEQGAWFRQKRNRNMVVEVSEDVELLDGFRWVTLGLVHRLLHREDLINMDLRTVLSCIPFAGPDLRTALTVRGDDFHAALVASCNEESGGLHAMSDILSWITEVRTRTEVSTRDVPLGGLPGWHRSAEKISHRSGLFFDVIGVDVRSGAREVNAWTQPMIAPIGTGLVAFLVTRILGVLHVLVHARAEPGYLDVVELAPTVQCTPDNYAVLPRAARPSFVDEVLGAAPEQIRFDTLLSEEGGRFYHSRNKYMIVEVDPEPGFEHPDFRWLTLHQLVDLLRHSHYLNVQARSLVACLHSLSARERR
ncbi:NDP-hexose 2,3-dehydratase family protein [Micromonospora halophytica]|uniref:NDP-hexose 2,3-dehydratase family protein n=1 Tax=Micromonospora halophytica TaxID=47864 RepID=UPI003CCBE109